MANLSCRLANGNRVVESITEKLQIVEAKVEEKKRREVEQKAIAEDIRSKIRKESTSQEQEPMATT